MVSIVAAGVGHETLDQESATKHQPCGILRMSLVDTHLYNAIELLRYNTRSQLGSLKLFIVHYRILTFAMSKSVKSNP